MFDHGVCEHLGIVTNFNTMPNQNSWFDAYVIANNDAFSDIISFGGKLVRFLFLNKGQLLRKTAHKSRIVENGVVAKYKMMFFRKTSWNPNTLLNKNEAIGNKLEIV